MRFLYGVVGSLVGSNLGGRCMRVSSNPWSPHGVEQELRNFWLLFAPWACWAMSGLVVYNKVFAEDTPGQTCSRGG